MLLCSFARLLSRVPLIYVLSSSIFPSFSSISSFPSPILSYYLYSHVFPLHFPKNLSLHFKIKISKNVYLHVSWFQHVSTCSTCFNTSPIAFLALRLDLHRWPWHGFWNDRRWHHHRPRWRNHHRTGTWTGRSRWRRWQDFLVQCVRGASHRVPPCPTWMYHVFYRFLISIFRFISLSTSFKVVFFHSATAKVQGLCNRGYCSIV